MVNVHQLRQCKDDCLTFPENLTQGMSELGRFLISVSVAEDMVDGTCIHSEQFIFLCVSVLKSSLPSVIGGTGTNIKDTLVSHRVAVLLHPSVNEHAILLKKFGYRPSLKTRIGWR